MLEVGSLEHVAVAYRDTVAAARWYREVLGFEVVLEATHPEYGVPFYFLKDPAGKGVIEVIPMPPSDDARLGDIRTSHVHIAFDVADMDAAVAALEAAGVELEGPPTTMGPNRLVFFRDPEGAPMQLVQRARPLL